MLINGVNDTNATDLSVKDILYVCPECGATKLLQIEGMTGLTIDGSEIYVAPNNIMVLCKNNHYKDGNNSKVIMVPKYSLPFFEDTTTDDPTTGDTTGGESGSETGGGNTGE